MINYHLNDYQPIYLVKKGKSERKLVKFMGRTYINYPLELLEVELKKIKWANISNEKILMFNGT